MRLWVALMRCPASLRLSIASSSTVSSSAMSEVYGRAAFDHSIGSPSHASTPTEPMEEVGISEWAVVRDRCAESEQALGWNDCYSRGDVRSWLRGTARIAAPN